MCCISEASSVSFFFEEISSGSFLSLIYAAGRPGPILSQTKIIYTTFLLAKPVSNRSSPASQAMQNSIHSQDISQCHPTEAAQHGPHVNHIKHPKGLGGTGNQCII